MHDWKVIDLVNNDSYNRSKVSQLNTNAGLISPNVYGANHARGI